MTPVEEVVRIMEQVFYHLVDDPNALTVDVVLEGSDCTLRVFARRSDLGKLIGQQGRTARSLRIIASALAMKADIRLKLDLLEARDDISEAL